MFFRRKKPQVNQREALRIVREARARRRFLESLQTQGYEKGEAARPLPASLNDEDITSIGT